MSTTDPTDDRTSGPGHGARALRVIVVGDVMLDSYTAGTVDRISPEAPVPVIDVVSEFDNLGGAGNVARQVVALGGRAELIGVVGADAAGARVRQHCVNHGIDIAALVEDAGRPTTTKQRITVGRQQIARIDRESTTPISLATQALIASKVGEGAPPDIVILSDYAKGVLTDGLIASLIEWCREQGVPVLADPKHRDLSRYRGAHLIKANFAEFEAARDHVVDAADSEAAAGRADAVRLHGPVVRRSAGVDHLIVTLGADGLVVVSDDAEPTVITSAVRDVYDVSGAGDTVIATLALQLAAGARLVDAAATANAAAGLAVQRRGVSVITTGDLASVLGDRADDVPKVFDRPGLAALAHGWRADGRRIVFTNGCFDLLHAGHVHLLRSAAALGDVLVVGVDSDASVRRLKGDARPIIGETERMSVISALNCVDAVIPFDSTELADLIAEVQPDVLVKGSDYATAEVVGGSSVIDNGGSVVLVPLLGDLSTTAVVGKIRNA